MYSLYQLSFSNVPTFNTAILPRSLRYRRTTNIFMPGANGNRSTGKRKRVSSPPSVACSTSLFDLPSMCQEKSASQKKTTITLKYTALKYGEVPFGEEKKRYSWEKKLVCRDVVPDHDSRRGRNQCGALHLSAIHLS